MVCKKEQFEVNKFKCKAFGINLNAQHATGMTYFDLAEMEFCPSLIKVSLGLFETNVLQKPSG